jgi:hypothetical protein
MRKFLIFFLVPFTLAAQTQIGGGSGGGSTSVAAKNSGLAGPLVIYPNAPPYNISFDGQVCYYVTWPNTSTLVTCNSGSAPITGAVASNVETISFNLASQPFNPLAHGWNTGDSVTVSIFSGADTYLNGTFTLTGVTANTVTMANVHANGSSTTNGLIVDSNVGPFVPADTGKLGFGTNCSTPLTCFPSPGGLATRPLGIVTYASPTTVNVVGNSTAALLTPTGGQFWWFTDDRAKWCCAVGSVDYNIGLAGSCVSVSVPAGTTPLPFGFGNNNSPNCGTVSNGASGVGNTSRQAVGGNNIWGQGIANTTFLLPPDSNYAACTGISTSVAGNVGCLFSNFMGGGNFTITGGGHCQTGSNAVVLFNPSASSTFWQNVTMTDYGCFDAASIGVNYPFANKFNGMYNSGFGGQACNANGVNVILTDSYCGETRLSPLKINGSGTVLRTENFYIGATASTIGVWVGSDASALTWTSLHDQSYGAVGAGGTHIFINGPATAYMTSWYNASGSAYGVQLTATGKLFLRDSSPINGSTHAIGTNGVTLTTGGVFNLGGNQFTGAALESTVLPSCVLTTGGGSPGQSCATANTEGNNAFDVVMTMGTTPGSTGTTTITYAGTNQINSGILPNLTCDLADGTGAWGSTANVKVSTRSATVPVVTWTNSILGVATALTAGNTYIISCQSEPN